MISHTSSTWLFGLSATFGSALFSPANADRVLMSYGDTIAGSIVVTGEIDTHTFNAVAGDVICVRANDLGGAMEPAISLYGPTGELASDWAYTTAEILTSPITQSGLHTINIWDHGHDEVGDYYLHVQNIKDPAAATTLHYNDTILGSLDYPSAMTAFTITGNANDHILLRLVEAVGSGDYYPMLRVYAQDGTLLASTTNPQAAQLNTVALPATGTYTVLAIDYNGINVGDFHMHAQRTNDPTGATAIAYGETLYGSATARGQSVAYTLSASTADVLLTRVTESGGDAEPNVRLYDPNGVQIVTDWNYTTAEFLVTDMPDTGDYTLLVMDHPGLDLFDYYVHVQDIHDPAGATTLGFNETLSGSLAYPAQTSAYTVTGDAGDRVFARLVEAVGSGDYYPMLRFYGRDGTLLDSSTNPQAAQLNTVALPATGTYTVLAIDYNGTNVGDFHMHAQRTNDPTGATAIAYGETLYGSATARGQSVAYTLSASTADVLLTRVTESGGDAEPNVRLYDPNGVQIVTDWNYTTAEFLVTDMPDTGDYTLLVMDHPGLDLFDYYVHVQDIHDPAGATTLGFNETLSGSLAYPAQTSAYTVTGDAGDRVFARLVEAVGSGDYYPMLRFYGRDGTLLDSSTNPQAAQLNTVALPATGTYTVLAIDYNGTNVGDFHMHAQRTNDPTGTTAIAYGETLAGSLTQRAQTVAYSLNASLYDVVFTRVVESAGDAEPRVRFYDPNGVQIATDWGYTTTEFLVAEMPEVDGSYTILIMDNPGLDLCDYYMYVQDIADPSGATPLAFGATLTGSIANPAQAATYEIQGTSNDTMFMRLVEAAGSGDYYTELRVYAPDGALLASTTNPQAAQISAVGLPQGGRCTILAVDYQGTGTGDFTVHAQRTNDPVGATRVEMGDTLAGTLTLRGESDAFTFVGLADDVVTLTMPEVSSELEPQLRLYGPRGALVTTDWSYSEASISGLTLTDSGLYTVLAMDNPGLDTGDYGLEVDGTGGTISVPELPVTELALHPCAPNPFNPITTIRYDLPQAEHVRITVHAVDGRLVTTLLDAPRKVGRHEAVWTGKDDAGRRVASGVYLVRMEAGDRRVVRRATLVK